MSSAFQVDGLLIKISKKIAVLLMKLPSLLMAEKIESKILLIDKAVVTLLIRSFFNNGELFANCTYTISCYIIAVQEVVALKEQKYHLYLSDDEYRQTIQSLVRLKNNLMHKADTLTSSMMFSAKCFLPRRESSKSNNFATK